MQALKQHIPEDMQWFSQLPEDWQSWVMENLTRGCDPQGIGRILHEHGFAIAKGNSLTVPDQEPSAQNAYPDAQTISDFKTADSGVADKGMLDCSVRDTPDRQKVRANSQLILSHHWKKWMARCEMDKVPHPHIIEVLRKEGFSDAVIQHELVVLKQNPYFELAQEIHLNLQKRNWLLDTVDHLAGLNPGYATRIDKIKAPDFAYFIQHYYSQHRPVVLTHGIDHWPALQQWDPQYLLEKAGDVMVEVQEGRDKNRLFERHSAQHRTAMLLKDFIYQILSTSHSNNIYMTANNAAKNSNVLARLFADIADFAEGYTELGQMQTRSFLWFGPKGTFTPLHHDLTNNMLVQIYGRKKVTLIPALQVPYLYNDKGVYSEVYNPLDSAEQAKYPLLARITPLEYVLEPGDALFIPIGWWHCVESLDVSISVSFTHFNADNDFAQDFPH